MCSIRNPVAHLWYLVGAWIWICNVILPDVSLLCYLFQLQTLSCSHFWWELYNSGELTSVYVRSLPSNVTTADLEKEFKKYGRIKPNGVFIRNKRVSIWFLWHLMSKLLEINFLLLVTQEIGVCFAFIEFEDMAGVQNAIKVFYWQSHHQHLFSWPIF